MPGRDAAECIWLFLRDDHLAMPLRALLVGGPDSVRPSGEITPEDLDTFVQARRNSTNLDRALCLAVHDGGESRTRTKEINTQVVAVRIYDRGRGYQNIRLVRDEIKRLFSNLEDHISLESLDLSQRRGLLSLEYLGRTGHRWDRYYAVEYEGLDYRARVIEEQEEVE